MLCKFCGFVITGLTEQIDKERPAFQRFLSARCSGCGATFQWEEQVVSLPAKKMVNQNVST